MYCPVHYSLYKLNEQISWWHSTRYKKRHLKIIEFKNKSEDEWNQSIYDADHVFEVKGKYETRYSDDYIRPSFPELWSDSSDSDDDSNSGYSTDDYTSSDDDYITMDRQLKQFDKISATGQLFLLYRGKRRKKPQDKIIKVTWNNKARPTRISWGSGTRHIDFNDIQYIAWGHWTEVFQVRTDQLDPRLCFSIVSNEKTIDLLAQTREEINTSNRFGG